MKNLTKKQEATIKREIKARLAAGRSINHDVFEEISEINEIPYQWVKDYYRYVINQNGVFSK
jgi:hypothetical protein